MKIKKARPVRGLWSYLFGHGWSGTGGSG